MFTELKIKTFENIAKKIVISNISIHLSEYFISMPKFVDNFVMIAALRNKQNSKNMIL